MTRALMRNEENDDLVKLTLIINICTTRCNLKHIS